MHKYLRQPHSPDCDCSVCWSKRELAKSARSQSTPCSHCRPATVSTVNGRLIVTPASYCAKHKPSPRPPKWWHVVQDTGKPTPYVPRWDLFESEAE
ncbi:lysogeny maintenance protein PflM [Phytopseudomonas daroniae]|uniref:lysogeny maintenance protein PflM n=1 Tax=Phytopseudomonas daroniae TaxID=2487519 RepID=UPI0010383AB5|nr:DUF5447 family protein [Pseudomonas daroniae]TBU73312.1 hypothetical protein DNK10_18795 [Pseudomonas daroniae]